MTPIKLFDLLSNKYVYWKITRDGSNAGENRSIRVIRCAREANNGRRLAQVLDLEDAVGECETPLC